MDDGVAAHEVPADDRGLNYADGAFETFTAQTERLPAEIFIKRGQRRAGTVEFQRVRDLVGQCFNEMEHRWTEALTQGRALNTHERFRSTRARSDATNPRWIVMAQISGHAIISPALRCGASVLG